ncbi:MAG: hypothetical protein LC130_15165, partial [Bryobacterales bacterium]|nr:hypothetical protein [Bryobacterales bacterium]
MKVLSSRIAALMTLPLLFAQEVPPPPRGLPPGFGPIYRPQTEKQEEPKQQPQPQAQPQTGTQPSPQTPAAAKPQGPAATTPQPSPPGAVSFGGLSLQNASLPQVIDQLARILKINYILDPRLKGSVVLNTYGDTRDLDPRNLLELILRINNAGMVQVGDIYRIVPLDQISRLPLDPATDIKQIPENDRTYLNLVFLKYATVDELVKVLQPFMGENSTTVTYPPANLLLILDSGRNLNRLMELIALFDSERFASQRVRLFEVKNGRPSDIADELESIFKGISLSEKNTPIKFVPLDRINTLIAIAPNPGVFEEVEKWLKRVDVAVKVTAGAVDNYVYRVKYGRAESLAGSIMMLYGGYGYGMGGYGMGGYGMGGYGMGGYG